jgi:2-amino-4-hydroxy-6-hydroxymethyldihydropteridine diphosphokinase
MKMLYLALGANTGERKENLRRAIEMIDERIGRIEAKSALYETAPVGFESKHLFLNAAVACRTDLTPEEILDVTQEIERELGRRHKSVDGQYADRTIDIDLLWMEVVVMNEPRLTLPHPRTSERAFMLCPLCDVAPKLRLHPNGETVEELLEKIDISGLKKVAEEF